METKDLVIEFKTFLLELPTLPPEEREKRRIDLVGKVEIWLHKSSECRESQNNIIEAQYTSGNGPAVDLKKTRVSYDSIHSKYESCNSSAYEEDSYRTHDESHEFKSRSNSIATEAPPQPGREAVSECFTSLPIPSVSARRDNGRKEPASRASGLMSSYSYVNLSASDAKHTGRLSHSLNLLRKAVTKPQYFPTLLFSDRLILFKSIKDNRPMLEINLQPESTVELQGKVGIRITELTNVGKVQSHSFTCYDSTEAHTWVDIISEVIRKLRDGTYDLPLESKSMDESVLCTDSTDSDSIYTEMSVGNYSGRYSWRKTPQIAARSARRFVRRLSREIRHASPKSSLTESPFGPESTESGGIEGPLMVRLPGTTEREERHCKVKDGIFSVFFHSNSEEAEFTFPLQCCDLIRDPEASNHDLRFLIVQGPQEKLSCEAYDCVSHIRWLKHLSVLTSNCASTVPDHLLSLSGRTDDEEEVENQDDNYYQIPISLKRFNPGMRQKIESIRQSLSEDSGSLATSDLEVGRSQQNLHNRSPSSASVRRSVSTRPLYNAEARQNLQMKARQRLLPDIERCLDLTEERQLECSSDYDDYNGAPLSSDADVVSPSTQRRCESAIYVEATPILNPTESTRSSRSTYSSASAGRCTDYSSGVGSGGSAERAEGDDDDGLILPTSHYSRSPADPSVDPPEENIYEFVEIPTKVVKHVASKSLTDGTVEANAQPRVSRSSSVKTTKQKPPVLDPPTTNKALMQDLSSAISARAKLKASKETQEEMISSTRSSPTKSSGAEVEPVLPTSSSADILTNEETSADTKRAVLKPALPPKPRRIQRTAPVAIRPTVPQQDSGSSSRS